MLRYRMKLKLDYNRSIVIEASISVTIFQTPIFDSRRIEIKIAFVNFKVRYQSSLPKDLLVAVKLSYISGCSQY